MISVRWKCYLVVLEQIYRIRNAFGWVKRNIQNIIWYFGTTDFGDRRLRRQQRLDTKSWIWPRFGSDFDRIHTIFSKSHQLPSNQKYIYTWSISNFFGFLKSYEAEKLENQVYVVRGHDLPPSPEKT